MSKPTAAVINRHIAKSYDRLQILVPKGEKEDIRVFAESRGQSLTQFVQSAIYAAMGRAEKSEEP